MDSFFDEYQEFVRQNTIYVVGERPNNSYYSIRKRYLISSYPTSFCQVDIYKLHPNVKSLKEFRSVSTDAIFVSSIMRLSKNKKFIAMCNASILGTTLQEVIDNLIAYDKIFPV